MTASIVKRLLWKEYRVQRGLWLALLLIAIGMQGLVWFSLQATMTRGEDILGALLGFGVLLGGFYALGSGCVTFASEREDDTHIRAVSMVYPPALTLLLKMLFGIVTTIAFVALTSGSAWLMRRRDLTLTPVPFNQFVLVSVWVTCLMLTAHSWGVCCSLLTRRVLTAMFSAAAATCVTYTFAINLAAFLPRYSPSQYDQNRDWVVMPFIAIITAVGLTGLFVVNLLLTRRWLNRDFTDGPRVGRSWLSFIPRVRLVRISEDGTLLIPISPEPADYLPVLSPEVAAIQPPPRSIRNWLGLMSLGRGRKTFGFLFWREWVETRRTFWLGIALLIVFQFVTRSRDGQFDPLQLSGTAIMLALACGFMTFRQEQADNQHRFLTFRGTSASQLWLSKHVVWLSRLVVGCAVLFASWMLIHWMVGGTFSQQNLRLLDDFTRTGFSGIGRAAIALLTLYAIGQTASLFIRRGIVSAFVTVLAGIVVGGWMGLMVSLAVPLWLSALPLALGLLFATLLRCRPWMMERNTFGTWYRPALVCIASVAACLSLTCLFRATELPDVGPITNRPRLVGSFFDTTLPATATEQDVAELLKPLTDAEKETAAIYRRAVTRLTAPLEAVGAIDIVADPLIDGALPRVSELEIRERQVLKLALQAAARPECALWHPSESPSLASEPQMGFIRPLLALVDLTLASAFSELAQGNPDVSLDYQLAALAMCRHFEARGARITSPNAIDRVPKVLSYLRKWAGHESVTKPLLDRAATELRRNRSLMLTPEARNVANHYAARMQAEHDISSLVYGDVAVSTHAGVRVHFNLPSERERLRRFINLHEREVSAGHAALLSQIGIAHDRPIDSKEFLYSVMRTDLWSGKWTEALLVPAPLRMSPSDDVASAFRADADFETDMRATLLTLHLLAEYRGRELPESLDSPAIQQLKLHDPWTGRAFVFFADGLPDGARFIGDVGVVEDDARLSQPFFITHGESVPVEYQILGRRVLREVMPGMSMGGGAAPGFPEPVEPKQPRDQIETELQVESRELTPTAYWQLARFPESAIYRLPKGAFQPHAVPAWKKLMQPDGQAEPQ